MPRAIESDPFSSQKIRRTSWPWAIVCRAAQPDQPGSTSLGRLGGVQVGVPTLPGFIMEVALMAPWITMFHYKWLVWNLHSTSMMIPGSVAKQATKRLQTQTKAPS